GLAGTGVRIGRPNVTPIGSGHWIRPRTLGLDQLEGPAGHTQLVHCPDLSPGVPAVVGPRDDSLVGFEQRRHLLRPLREEIDPKPADSQSPHPADILGRALGDSVKDRVPTARVSHDRELGPRPVAEVSPVAVAWPAAVPPILAVR